METSPPPNNEQNGIYHYRNINARSQCSASSENSAFAVPLTNNGDRTELLPELNYDCCIQEPLGQFSFYSVYVLVAVSLGVGSNYAAVLSSALNAMAPTWTCTIAIGTNQTAHRMNKSDSGVVGGSDCSCPVSNRNYSNVDNFFSIRRTFGLLCDKQYAFSVLPSLVMVGGLLGTIFVGQAGDIFGRRKCLILSAIGCIGANVSYSYASTFPMACVVTVLIGFFAFGHDAIAYTTLFESVGRKYRLLASCFNLGFSLGFVFIATLGRIWSNWRGYQRSVAVIQVVVVVLWCFAQESPRWLIRRKKLKAAAKAIRKIAKFNQRPSPLTISETPLGSYGATVNEGSLKTPTDSAENELLCTLYEHIFRNELQIKNTSYIDLFRKPIRRNTLVMIYLWFTSSLIGFSLYEALGTIGGSVYTNAGLTGIIKCCVGFLPLAANVWVGRRPLLLVSLCVLWASMFAIAIVKTVYFSEGSETNSIVIACSLIGISGMEPVWKVIIMYASEIFPTTVRSQANGLCTFGARIGGILAPQVLYIGKYHAAVPYAIFAGVVVFQIGAAYVWLPEAKGQPMMDNIENDNIDGTKL